MHHKNNCLENLNEKECIFTFNNSSVIEYFKFKKMAVINPHNKDDKCFAHAVNVAHYGFHHREKNAKLKTNIIYPKFEIFLNFDGIKVPVSLKDPIDTKIFLQQNIFN